MTREEALEWFKDRKEMNLDDKCQQAEDMAIKALEQEPSSSEKPNKWIPVRERLPEDKQAVLVWCPQYKNIYCAYLEKEQWWIFGAFVQIVPNEVIAWMPLPEPYRAESEEV